QLPPRVTASSHHRSADHATRPDRRRLVLQTHLRFLHQVQHPHLPTRQYQFPPRRSVQSPPTRQNQFPTKRQNRCRPTHLSQARLPIPQRKRRLVQVRLRGCRLHP